MDFYLDMVYDVQLNQVDEDHEEVNELKNYQVHLTKNLFYKKKKISFKIKLTRKIAKPK
jgi:hypothetical protein